MKMDHWLLHPRYGLHLLLTNEGLQPVAQLQYEVAYVMINSSTMVVLFSLNTALRIVLGIINPRRACAARVTVVVLCVCLFVYYYSRTTGYEAAYERYQQIQCYKGRKNNVAILLKRLRSRDMA